MRISDWSSDVCSSDLFANLYLVFDHSISNVRLLSSAAAMTIPENITRLHDGEEKLRAESLRRIEERSDTSAHLVIDRKSVVQVKSVSERVSPGGIRLIKKKKFDTIYLCMNREKKS